MIEALRETGFSQHFAPALGAIVVACAVCYANPETTALGANLVTAFMGGAVCAHVRLGEIGSPPELVSLGLGGLAWAGLALRDRRLRPLLPLTRPDQDHD